MTPTSPTCDALRALVAKWRERIDDSHKLGLMIGPHAIKECVDDLEAVLRAQPPQKRCYTCTWVYERVCRQMAEPRQSVPDDYAAMVEIATAIESKEEPA